MTRPSSPPPATSRPGPGCVPATTSRPGGPNRSAPAPATTSSRPRSVMQPWALPEPATATSKRATDASRVEPARSRHSSRSSTPSSTRFDTCSATTSPTENSAPPTPATRPTNDHATHRQTSQRHRPHRSLRPHRSRQLTRRHGGFWCQSDRASPRHAHQDELRKQRGARPKRRRAPHPALDKNSPISEVLTGDHRAAVAHLTDAMAGFTRLGATPLQESCRGDLGGIGAAGARAPADLEWGPTERESVVVAFVRRGFTNKEIAREMIVRVKAVDYHLTRIYAKAGVHGRHELRCALTTEPEPSAS